MSCMVMIRSMKEDSPDSSLMPGKRIQTLTIKVLERPVETKAVLVQEITDRTLSKDLYHMGIHRNNSGNLNSRLI